MTQQTRPNPQTVLNGLKDFQCRTVDYAFQRLYTDPNPTNRFLIADEVGLGKTLVARGLIAKAIDHLWDKVGRIDIIYICSNAEIARQNIQRLKHHRPLETLALPHVSLCCLYNCTACNKIALTLSRLPPGTSFDMKSNLGMAEERILLHQLLDQVWRFWSSNSSS